MYNEHTNDDSIEFAKALVCRIYEDDEEIINQIMNDDENHDALRFYVSEFMDYCDFVLGLLGEKEKIAKIFK